MRAHLAGLAMILIVTIQIATGPARADAPATRPDGSRFDPQIERVIQLETMDDPLHERGPTPRLHSPARVSVRGAFSSIQVNVDTNGMNVVGDAANEPSIAVNPLDPNQIVIGWRQFDTIANNFRQAGVGHSADGGQTWTADTLDPGNFRSDPVLGVDSAGNFYYHSLQGSFLCDFFISNDGGASWSAPVPAFGGDKNWFTIDRSGGIGDGHIYADWSVAGNPFFPAQFTRSTNGGASFEAPLDIPSDPIWGTLAVDRNGNLFLAGVDSSNFGNHFVLKSTNAQNSAVTPTFTPTAVTLGGSTAVQVTPNPVGLAGQVYVCTDNSTGPHQDNVYVLASVNPIGSDPLDVHFVRSTDGGSTWSSPVRVNDDAAGTNAWQWFGAMSVAPSGRIDVIWNDTRNDPLVMFSELMYSYSTDAGVTWSDNVAISAPFNHALGYPQQNKLGDYYDLVADAAGAHIAYAATFNGEQDVYSLRLVLDCNGNDVHDGDDLASGAFTDVNGNGVLDVCEVGYGDFDGDGDVDLTDFATFGQCFGGANNPPAAGCPAGVDADSDGDGDVDLTDFALFAQNFTGSQ